MGQLKSVRQGRNEVKNIRDETEHWTLRDQQSDDFELDTDWIAIQLKITWVYDRIPGDVRQANQGSHVG
jgi:hypothetical protein